jgi:hypothetical protein
MNYLKLFQAIKLYTKNGKQGIPVDFLADKFFHTHNEMKGCLKELENFDLAMVDGDMVYYVKAKT